MSDTTKSAANVAAKLGKDQEDCAMHESSNGHNSHLLPMYRKLVQGVADKTTFKVMKLKRAEPQVS